MYKTIELLKPYFFSLREINNTLSLDIKIPSKWVYDIVSPKYDVRLKMQDKNNDSCLLSIISHSNDVGCLNITTCAMEIIKLNKEKEEKERLFEEKVSELQQLFINKSLEDLKNLNFVGEYENGNREGIRIDGEGIPEISEGTTDTEDQIN